MIKNILKGMTLKISSIVLISLFFVGCQTTDFMGLVRKRVDTYLARHPETPQDIKDTMFKLNIKLGMNMDQVKAVIGEPYSVKDGIINNVSRQEWTYRGAYAIHKSGGRARHNVYYYFENGIFTDWDTDVTKYIKAHPDIPEEIKKALRDEKILIGMNEEQVKLIYGAPDYVSRIKVPNGIRERWVYGTHSPVFLYFENATLQNWGK